MTTRIFSHKHQLYTDSPFWPSNQRTTSEFALNCNGEVLEIVNGGEEGVIEHDSRSFATEPWTGLFDSKGKKIYLGDILKLNSSYNEHEVVWSFDRFLAKSSIFGLMPMFDREDLLKNFSVVGTIHGVNF
jgi:hypothetical protein